MKPRFQNRFLPVSILFVGLAASALATPITTTNVTGPVTLSGTTTVNLGTPGASNAVPGNADLTNVTGGITGTLALGGTLTLADNANYLGFGSVGAGAYEIFTQTGLATGSFATINNIAGYHAKVDTSTSGFVYLDNYQIATAAPTQTVNVGSFHVGTAKTAAVTLTNTAPVNATYTETLQTNGFSGTSANFSATGSVSGIVGGGSGSGTLLVGVGAGLGSGLQSGTTTLALQSNAVNGSGLGTTNLSNQTITINATGYNLASANTITTPISLGNIRVAASFSPSALSIQNTAPATYSEGLDASFGATTGSITTNGGSFSNLAGQATSTSMSVGLSSPATAGAKTGTVAVNLTSDGTNSTLANTTLASQTITVNGAAYDYANAKYNGGTLAFGNVRVGSVVASQTVAFGNQTVTNASYQDLLDVSATTGNAKVTATGFTGLAASTGGAATNNLTLSANTATAGTLVSTETLTLTSNANGVAGLSNGTATVVGSPAAITTTGGVYDYANAKYTGATLAFGNVRVGSVVASQSVAFGNQTVTNASYQDFLDVSATTGNAKVTATGFTGLAASAGGATTNNLTLAVSTATAGSLASTETLTLVSNANGVAGLSNGTATVVGSPAAITTTGNVYDYANAKYTGGNLAFGNLHVGAVAANQAVAFGNQTVTNASYQDSLDVSATTGNAKVTATGFTGLLASTGGLTTNNLTFAVNTTSAASLASTASLTLTSNANGVSGLSNGTATVVGSPSAITTTGQVYSGQMIWTGATGGSWVTDANWNDSTNAGVHVAPGLDAGFTGVDTATFGNTVGNVTVNLNGVNPNLNAIKFTGTGSYTIAQGSGGGLTLGGTAPSITSTGTQVISAPVTLAGNLTASVTNSSDTLTVSGAIGETGGARTLTKTGAGLLILSNVNTYTGATAISAGTLNVNGSLNAASTVNVGTAGTLGGTGTVNGNATLTGNGVINFGVGGKIVGTLGVTGGNWNGQGSVTGVVTSSSGTFTIGAGANLTATSGLTVSGGLLSGTGTLSGSLNYTSSADSNFAGKISDSGSASSVTLNSGSSSLLTGTLTLTGVDNYTGATNVTSGALIIGSNGALSGSGVTVNNGGTLIIAGGVTTTNAVPISIAGVGAVPVGALVGGGFVSGAATYTGAITLAANATIGAYASVPFTLSGGISEGTHTITFGATGNDGTASTIAANGVISGSGGVIVDYQTTSFGASNTYTGTTAITNGAILNANVAGALPAPAADGGTGTARSALSMDQTGSGSSTLNLGTNQTVASLTGAASSRIHLNTSTLTVGITGGSATFAGVISGGGGSLIKDETSTQILSGNNTYGGSTTILNGTLQLGVNNALPVTTSVTINPADGSTPGVLNLAGFNQALAANGSGNALTIVAPSANLTAVSGAGTLTLNGNVALVDNTTAAGNGQTTTIAAGTLDLGGAVRTFAVAGQNLGYIGSDLTVSSVIQNGGVIVNATNSSTFIDEAFVKFSGANNYAGTTEVQNGVLLVSNNTALGTADGMAATGTTVDAGATLGLDSTTAGGLTVGNESLVLNGSGAIYQGGALVVYGSGAATYGGPITVATSSTINANGGTLTLNGPIDKTGVTLTLAGGGAGGTINVNGVISGNSGTFNSDLVVNGVTANLNAANTYLGPTYITSINTGDSVLNANLANALPTANGRTSISMDATGAGGSTLNIGGTVAYPLGASQAIASLTGDGSSKVTLGNNTLTIGYGTGINTNGTANADFAGGISGAGGSLVKDGTSTQRLSGSSTYTGTTSINGGTLNITGTGSLTGTSGVTVANAGTFINNGTLSAGTMSNSGTFTALGSQTITGNFTNTASGILQTTITAVASGDVPGDHPISVGGTAKVGGTIALTNTNTGTDPGNGSSYKIIQTLAANYDTSVLAGVNLDSTFSSNIQGAYENWAGDVRFGLKTQAKPSAAWDGMTINQTQAYASLFEDEIQRGIVNVTYNDTTGWTFDNHSQPVDGSTSLSLQSVINFLGLLPDAVVVNGRAAWLDFLSPEVYVGLSDYAIQATRAHQRTAFDAPAITSSGSQPAAATAAGSKDAPEPVAGTSSQWEVFAAADFFNVNTNNSLNNADYGLTSYGAMVGARARVTDRIKLAAYVAGDEGDVRGNLIDASGNGWSLGLLGEAMLNEAHGTRLTAGVSYGRYSFDGTRTSLGGTSVSTVAPGKVHFSGVDTDALELSLGIETVAFHTDHFRLIPSAGLHYATGSVGAFSETTGAAPGSPIALVVNRINNESLLAEVSLIAEADVTSKLTLRGQVGLSNEFRDKGHDVTARFADGSRPMTVQGTGVQDDAVFLGFGATYKFTDAVSAGLNYRAEFRTGCGVYNAVNLGATIGF